MTATTAGQSRSFTTIAWGSYTALGNACHVTNGRLICDRCRHRIPTKRHSEVYEPKYPFCPWCGAMVKGVLR